MGLLVLTRGEQERIHLYLPDGRRVVVTLIEARPSRARLGIEAPEDVRILREELESERGGES